MLKVYGTFHISGIALNLPFSYHVLHRYFASISAIVFRLAYKKSLRNLCCAFRSQMEYLTNMAGHSGHLSLCIAYLVFIVVYVATRFGKPAEFSAPYALY